MQKVRNLFVNQVGILKEQIRKEQSEIDSLQKQLAEARDRIAALKEQQLEIKSAEDILFPGG